MRLPIIMEPQPELNPSLLTSNQWLRWRGETWSAGFRAPVPVIEQCPYLELSEEPVTVEEVAGAWCWIVETEESRARETAREGEA